jgi:alpha-N-arabinofuranosidase
MFSRNRGTTILPVSSTANFGPVYWVASSKSPSKTRTVYYVKLANYGKRSQTLRIRFDGTTFGSKATYTVLSGLKTTANYPSNSAITPKVSTVEGDSTRGYSVDIPAWGVAVFAVAT